RGVHEKLVRRHPHVFGDVEARTAERVRSNWERIKREQEGREGIFHDVAEGLPGLLYARKIQQRAKVVGFEYPDLAGALADLADELRELEDEPSGDELGDVLFAAVNVARRLDVDPELELRRAAQRFRRRVEAAEELAGMEAADQEALDRLLIELDGTPNKGRLGANAVLGVSLANAKAAAADSGVSLFRHLGGEEATTLPVPMLNVINGGVHADNSIDLQEFMVVPVGASSFAEALQIGAETYHALQKVLKEEGLATAVGDEGGFAPDLPTSEAAIEAILSAAERAGHHDRVAIALDPASSELYRDGVYRFEGREAGPAEIADFWAGLVDRFPIVSIEDGNAEDDWDGWQAATEKFGDRIQLVRDDIFVTNPERLQPGLDRCVAHSILPQVHHIGTLPGTIPPATLAPP